MISLCNSDTLSSYSSSATSSRRLRWYFSCSNSCKYVSLRNLILYSHIHHMCGETENVHNGNFLKLHPFRLAVNGRQVVEGARWHSVNQYWTRERLLTVAHYEGWILAVALGKAPGQHMHSTSWSSTWYWPALVISTSWYWLVMAKAIGWWPPPPGPCCGLLVPPLVSHLVLAKHQRKHPNPTSFVQKSRFKLRIVGMLITFLDE